MTKAKEVGAQVKGDMMAQEEFLKLLKAATQNAGKNQMGAVQQWKKQKIEKPLAESNKLKQAITAEVKNQSMSFTIKNKERFVKEISELDVQR